MGGAFYGAYNMEYNAADAPDLSSVTDMGQHVLGMHNAFDGDLSELGRLGRDLHEVHVL